jgi:hypothetical protein
MDAMRMWVALAITACGRLGFDPVPDPQLEPCSTAIAGDTIALYTFDDALGRDTTGAHDATTLGAAAATTGGPCGAALEIPVGGSFLHVADSTELDLDAGAVDLYAREAQAFSTYRGVVSRDAIGTGADGHFTIGFMQGVVFARLQLTGDQHFFRCSDAPHVGEWIHIAVSFGSGGMTLWIDGQRQAMRDTIDLGFGVHDCRIPYSGGMEGNDNPMVIGAERTVAVEGDPAPSATGFFIGGQIDHLRIRDRWVDFDRGL